MVASSHRNAIMAVRKGFFQSKAKTFRLGGRQATLGDHSGTDSTD